MCVYACACVCCCSRVSSLSGLTCLGAVRGCRAGAQPKQSNGRQSVRAAARCGPQTSSSAALARQTHRTRLHVHTRTACTHRSTFGAFSLGAMRRGKDQQLALRTAFLKSDDFGQFSRFKKSKMFSNAILLILPVNPVVISVISH